MPFLDSDGVDVYYEVVGEGAPLVLQHGLTGNLGIFKLLGYTEGLRGRYKLILIDARGHGRSGKPSDSKAYRLRSVAGDVVAVLDERGVERSHFRGYSMGGSIGLGLGVYSPERFMSLIIGGWGMAETDSPEEIERRRPTIEWFGEGLEAMVARFEEMGAMSPEWREGLMMNDTKALIALWSVREHVGFEERLPQLGLPCLFYAGEEDYLYQRAKRTAEVIPGARFVSIPDLDHVGTLMQSAAVLPHVLDFLDSIP